MFLSLLLSLYPDFYGDIFSILVNLLLTNAPVQNSYMTLWPMLPTSCVVLWPMHCQKWQRTTDVSETFCVANWEPMLWSIYTGFDLTLELVIGNGFIFILKMTGDCIFL